MDVNAKKTALRMIPYGLYVLTAANRSGQVAAATVNWVTQVAFEPPLVVVGVKVDSHAHPECRLEATVEKGDHSVFVGRVVEAGVARSPEGRADEATLWLRDLGDKVYYGG